MRLQVRDLVLEVPAPAGGRRRLLDGISLDLRDGECVGLIGPNGAGKTTLLRAVAGLVPRSGGEVLLDGRPVNRMADRDRARRVGLVPPAAEQTIDFTAVEVVLMGRYPHLRPFQPEGAADRALAREALAEVEMAGFEQRRTSTLSSGERQRVLLARGRCQAPECLLCDEPTANLDLRHRAVVFQLLAGLAQNGTGVLAAVHDLDLAARYCSRLVLMAGGHVLADGTPDHVLTAARLLEAYEVEAEVRPDPVTGTPRVTVLRPADLGVGVADAGIAVREGMGQGG